MQRFVRLFSIALCFAVLVSAASGQTFTAFINSAQEVPTNSSTGKGFARIFLNESAGTINFTVSFSGLSSNQSAAHIHGAAGVGTNAGVLIDLGAVGGTSGTITGTRSITPTQIASLKSNQTYVNIHSANFPGGEIRGQVALRRVLDFDGDGATDLSILRFPNVSPPGVSQITVWNRNSQGFASNQTVQWGNANTDFPCPGDYDGDGEDDFCMYRAGASAGQQSFFINLRSSDLTIQWVPWGVNGDQAVNRDYDGDGRTDFTVFRRGATATDQTQWYILRSSTNSLQVVPFGTTGNGTTSFDTPIPGDYDGDGKFDVAVYRFGQAPANYFIIRRSSDNGVTYQSFGNFNTDYIVPGDYDGDGKFDYAVARTGATGTSPLVWWILQSSNLQTRTVPFGISSDAPTQGDYDGDGKTDVAIWRRANSGSDSAYFILGSFAGVSVINWGINGDFSVNGFDAR